jgi:glycosyltransferase involved in cell wall biosynthesis
VPVTGRKYKVSVVSPTPFFYQVALYRDLAAHSRIDLTVYFCSDEGLSGRDVVKQFNTVGQWGGEEDILTGYTYKFLRNYSPYPSYLNWPIGLINLGIWGELRRSRPDALILMSWMNPTWWLAALACARYRIPLLYLTDANIQREQLSPWWKSWPKRLLLGAGLFKFTSGFLCAGEANKQLYRHYGVPDSKLVDFAYSWGYESLLKAARELAHQRDLLRSQLGIAKDGRVILYCGRFSPEKGLYVLLEAFRQLELPGKALIFVGDGKLRGALEAYTAKHNLDSVQFLGFKDRREIPEYYAAADVLVLPSFSETAGLVINEAMCFRLPVIVSDQVGSGMDLVKNGYNGFIFPVGDSSALAGSIKQLFDLPERERQKMGARSLDLMTKWTQRDLAASLLLYLDLLYLRKDGVGIETSA